MHVSTPGLYKGTKDPNSGMFAFMTDPWLIESSCFYHTQCDVLKYIYIVKLVTNVVVRLLKIKSEITIRLGNSTANWFMVIISIRGRDIYSACLLQQYIIIKPMNQPREPQDKDMENVGPRHSRILVSLKMNAILSLQKHGWTRIILCQVKKVRVSTVIVFESILFHRLRTPS